MVKDSRSGCGCRDGAGVECADGPRGGRLFAPTGGVRFCPDFVLLIQRFIANNTHTLDVRTSIIYLLTQHELRGHVYVKETRSRSAG